MEKRFCLNRSAALSGLVSSLSSSGCLEAKFHRLSRTLSHSRSYEARKERLLAASWVVVSRWRITLLRARPDGISRTTSDGPRSQERLGELLSDPWAHWL